MRIRAATVDDARAVAEVHNEGWRWGYRGLVPQAVLDARDDDSSEQRWIHAFTDEWREGEATFLAEDDAGRAIGMISCGPAAQNYGPSPPQGFGEVYALYLRGGVQGSGVGRALLVRGVDHLREAGFQRAVLWVIDANERARRFYEADGWRPDGETGRHRFEDDGEIRVVRYARDL
jgi:GNAT superfamily N-acetyltransferase